MSDNQRMIAGRYTLGSLIGRGGMADVYEGTDTVLGRKVAIKLLKADLAADPNFESRFRQEAQAAARMAHPTIVRVYDAGEESTVDINGTEHRTPFIVMEYVRGVVLRDLLHQRRLSVPESIGYAEGVLTALEFSHKAGIIHRDIKSANIMVTDTGLVKVMDFGIARAMSDGTATQAHTTGIVGTAQYFSPEQARGETVDARTDLYSTGVLLYEMLAGRQPFTGDTAVSVAYQHVSEAVTPPSVHNPQISPMLDEVVLRALAKDRSERFQSAEEFRDHLLAASMAPAVAVEPVITPLTEEAVEPPTEIFEDIFADEIDPFDALLGEAVEEVAAPAATEVFDAPAAKLEESTYTGPITNPFSTLGVEFPTPDTDEDGKKIPSSKGNKPSPGLIWGIGSGLAVVLVGLLVWGLTVGFKGFNFTPSQSGHQVADVTGQTYDAGAALLQGSKLLVLKKFEMSETVAEGMIIRTDPPAGTKVSDGTMVTVYVSTGKNKVTMPDLVGMSEQQATDSLTALGLVLGEIKQVNSASVPVGMVVESDPFTGSSIAAGSTVNLWISNGKVNVPNVVNLDVAQAKATLEGAEIGFIVEIAPQTACAGGAAPTGTIVLSQSIPAGTADAGSTIVLYVACTP